MHIAGTIYLSLIGVITAVLGLREAAKNIQLWINGIQAEGTVVGQTESGDGDGGTSYCYIIEFETLEGERVRCAGGIGVSKPNQQALGRTVPVRYLLGQPQKARPWTVGTLLLAPLALCGMSGVCLFVILQR